MNWTDSIQQAVRAWADTQQKVASEWSRAAQAFAPPATATPSVEWAEQWRDTALKAAQQWTGNLSGVPRSVSERMTGGAQAYLRFAELFSDALRQAAPKAGSGETWAQSIARYTETLRGSLGSLPQAGLSPAAAAAMTGDASELWQLYLSQLQSLATPWSASVQEASGHLGEAMAGDHRAIIRTANLFTDTFESTLGKLLAAPAIGYTREFQEKLTKAFECWVDARKAEAEFHGELLHVGVRALEALGADLAERSKSGDKITSYRQLFDAWVEVAEKTYFEAASNESFAGAQARLVNASMHYRIHERVLLEVFFKAFHLPTRSEIDDAYKHMHEMRKDFKALKRQVGDLRKELAELQRQASAAPAPAAKPAAKAPAAASKKAPAGRSATPRKRTTTTKKEG